MLDEPVVNKPLIGVAIAVVLAAFGGWYYWYSHSVSPPPVPVVVPPPAEPVADDAIAHPVPPPTATNAPLPALGESDRAFSEALAAACGAFVTQFLAPDNVIRHIVVTVDNLPRQKVAVEKRPIAPVPGAFMADGDELHATLDAQNFKRYEPMVGALQKIDMQRLTALYQQFYALFQKAYQDLGYPNGYFNDRALQVIDGLLATPQISGPIELVRPNVMYMFADPALEARPAGQKLLIRMGPDNEAAVKTKLEELRAAITALPAKR